MANKENEDWADSGDWGTDSWTQKDSKKRVWPEKTLSIKILSVSFTVVLLLAVIILGAVGWGGVQTAIDLQFPETAEASEQAGESESAPAEPPDGGPDWAGDKGLLEAAARQHYLTLATIAGILVLLPSLLLTAYVLQKVPRLTKDLEADLKKLGIYDPEINPYKSQQELEEKINELAPRLKSHDVVRLAESISDINLEFETFDIDIGRYRSFPADKLSKLKSFYSEQHNRLIKARDENSNKLISERFASSEYLLPLLPLSLFLLASFSWLFWPAGMPDFLGFTKNDSAIFGAYFAERIAAMLPALASVLAAYVFLIFHLVRRNNASDLTPGAFWEALKRLAIVFLLGLVVSAFGPAENNLAGGVLIIAAVFIGLFPMGFLGIVARGGQAYLQAWVDKKLGEFSQDVKIQSGKSMAERLYARHELTLLDDLDEWDAIRLEEANIYGLQGMATADLANLIAWVPFPTSQVVDWVDQSLLYMASGAEPDSSFAETFRTIGLRRASSLVEMGREETGRDTIVLAARAVQSSGVFDPLPVAQLAAVRAQLQIKDMQEKVVKVKGKTTSDNLDVALKADVETMISLIASAGSLVEQAYEQVRLGGDLLKDALANQADPLKSVFKAADEEAKKAETELKAIAGDNPKVSEKLAAALKTLGDKLAGDPDANARAKSLVDELDRVFNPLKETEAKTGEFVGKAEKLQSLAQATSTDVPAQVQEAIDILAALTKLAKDAQERIKADASLADVLPTVRELIKELESVEDGKAQKLLGDEKLKKKESWTTEGSDKKAQCAADTDTLLEAVKVIEEKSKSASAKVAGLRAEKAAKGASLPLTREVLLTILAGLVDIPNLKRIQHYYRYEGRMIP
jgi:hypothetical protein